MSVTPNTTWQAAWQRPRRLALAATCLVLSGCAHLAGWYMPDPITTAEKSSTKPYVKDRQIDLSLVTDAEFSGQEKQSARRELAAIMLDLSDRACALHKTTIYSNSATVNLVGGVSTIVLSGYAAVAKNAVYAANAAAGATATAAIQAKVSQEVYQAQLGSAIANAIDYLRAQELVQVNAVINKPEATVSEVVSSINRYHQKCSLVDGVAELSRALEGQRANTARQQDLDRKAVRQELKAWMDQLEVQANALAKDSPEEQALRRRLTALQSEYEKAFLSQQSAAPVVVKK
ncbi:hypothetical protein [Roseateles sp.]|uniref:hypothetical protein n=1 Tax=Roseateles sp. TaxID=1971397 RepID=UPI003BA819EA